METMLSVEALATEVNRWCERHGIVPANGQAGERITERNVRYYRTLGLLDPPLTGGGQGYGEKHRLQLAAVRLLQAQGLPLHRIRDLLLGRSVADLREIERRGLAELAEAALPVFRPAENESWRVTPLDDEFLLVSRRGRGLTPALRERLLEVLGQETELTNRRQTDRSESGPERGGHKKGN
jgi:DNA-binding transcriptional MerR regulator